MPVSGQSSITVGWPIGVVMIVGGWLLTGLYVRRANGDLDRLNAQLVAVAETTK
ncbi:Inner membrane protein YjcH [compost metagenome]